MFKASYVLTILLVYLTGNVVLPLHHQRVTSVQTTTPTWGFTGSLHQPRFDHSATLLTNGKVLVVGGVTNGINDSAESYDPVTGAWTITGSLTIRRDRHTATLLPNGKVLVAGGFTSAPGAVGSPAVPATNTAELYDPTTGMWTATGTMNSRRAWHSATLLPNGRVLVVGGLPEAGYVGHSTPLNTAELYDPQSGAWSPTGSLKTGRGHVIHTATLLRNGKVLVAGGSELIYEPFTVDEEVSSSLASSELYDPVKGEWSVTGTLNGKRILHTATLLLNGQVLVAGGGGTGIGILIDMPDTAELFDPTSETWSLAGHLNERVLHTATLLANGCVLVTGGEIYENILNSAEIFDPDTKSWTSAGTMRSQRAFHTATLLANGRVLLTGGLDGRDGVLASAELFDSGLNSSGNPIDEAQFFVRQQYLDFLNREPDPQGLTFWTNQILSCGNDQQCVEVARINVSAAFFLSIEFQNTGYFVERIYKVAYGDANGTSTIGGLHSLSVPIVRLDEFLADSRKIGEGVIVLQPGWNEVLERNKRTFTEEVVQRSSFTTAFPSSMSAAEFVERLNSNAGGFLLPADLDQLVVGLLSGIKTRAQILREVAEQSSPDDEEPGPNLASAEFNRAFVLMQYFGYLRRNPNDAPDSDYSGFDFWLKKLNAFEGNFVNAEMVKAFLSSTEYRRRFH